MPKQGVSRNFRKRALPEGSLPPALRRHLPRRGRQGALGPLCEGAPPAGGGGENLFPGDYDYIRQGRGHNVCLAVSRDGAEQAVDVCFDLTAAPAGDFSLAFDGGLTLAYADADRTCCLTFTDDAMSGGRTSRYVKLDAPCRRLRVVGDAPA